VILLLYGPPWLFRFAGGDSHKAFSLHESWANRARGVPENRQHAQKCQRNVIIIIIVHDSVSRFAVVGREWADGTGVRTRRPQWRVPYIVVIIIIIMCIIIHCRREPTADGVPRFDVCIKIMVGSRIDAIL